MLKKLFLSLAVTTALFAQHDAAINLNNDDIELQSNVDLGELNQSDYPDTYFLTLGFLDVENRESTDPLFSAGFKLRQDIPAVPNLRFGIGLKGTYAKVASGKHVAVPLGAELVYSIPLADAMALKFSGFFDYAPSALAFKDADNYMEKRLEVGFQIVEQATIFAGYRDIDLDFEVNNNKWDYRFDDDFYVGFRVRF